MFIGRSFLSLERIEQFILGMVVEGKAVTKVERGGQNVGTKKRSLRCASIKPFQ
ncbi:hypothetical protein [Vibrio sp. 10N.261.55.A7]|uniref:hypothetical protein n=1 Tax=Vibrio sp. 10N.261.55.A7 TaxID=1880851 RepID=UPI0012FFD923|nr:hypothetical protein [Vibrio sp. 10N.261.55.A7]